MRRVFEITSGPFNRDVLENALIIIAPPSGFKPLFGLPVSEVTLESVYLAHEI
jgi:hypothetical protein